MENTMIIHKITMWKEVGVYFWKGFPFLSAEHDHSGCKSHHRVHTVQQNTKIWTSCEVVNFKTASVMRQWSSWWLRKMKPFRIVRTRVRGCFPQCCARLFSQNWIIWGSKVQSRSAKDSKKEPWEDVGNNGCFLHALLSVKSVKPWASLSVNNSFRYSLLW